MWQHDDNENNTPGSPNNWEQPWACTEVLQTLADLNEQCLELLTEQALLRASPAPPMFRDLMDLWTQLDAGSRRRAAECPYLLIDAGFADPYRWRWPVGDGVNDREPAAYSSFFTAAGTTKVAQQVFTNAWYIVRTRRVGAPIHLGMPPHCANLLRACTMLQVTELATQHAGRLRPRWAGRVRIWRELLEAAISGDGVALLRARQRGLQLLAIELRAFEQVSARESTGGRPYNR